MIFFEPPESWINQPLVSNTTENKYISTSDIDSIDSVLKKNTPINNEVKVEVGRVVNVFGVVDLLFQRRGYGPQSESVFGSRNWFNGGFMRA